jgi:rhodanese-related sulfurtransferase
MSTKVAGSAVKDGYTNVKAFLDGAPAWQKAGHPVFASKGHINNGNIVLIDLRSNKKSEAGRIARAVTLPYANDTFDDNMEEIPKKAPIVLYSDSAEEVADALSDLRDEGYKKVSLVSGNYAGWVKAGGKTVTGPVTSEIKWVRKLGKGEVGKADFLKAATGKDAGAVILDVRTDDEVASGAFTNSIHVPLDAIGKNLNKIPKDKKIYVHCTTGARADMAAAELKKNGYKAFFFVANIDCDGNECEVED